MPKPRDPKQPRSYEPPSIYHERLTAPMKFAIRDKGGASIDGGKIVTVQSDDPTLSAEEVLADAKLLLQPSLVGAAFSPCDASCTHNVHVRGSRVAYTHVTEAGVEDERSYSIKEVEADPAETAVELAEWMRTLHA